MGYDTSDQWKKGSKSIHLKVNGEWVTEKKNMAYVLGETYQSNFSYENSSEECKTFIAQEEQNYIRFDCDNTKDYNEDFKLCEFKTASLNLKIHQQLILSSPLEAF